MLHASVRQLIADRYHFVHGAWPPADYPAYHVVRGSAGPRAVLGYRRAAEGPLFLEVYLDQPIEEVLAQGLGRRPDRALIVELGAHASDQSNATVRLWAEAARVLAPEAEFAVAVLTARMRSMFRRIGLAFVELAPARPERLGAGVEAWGRYYEADPVVCAGEIAVGGACLAAWCERVG
jgi:hypothetical protein